MGRFEMTDLNLTKNDNGTLSGTGQIEVPVLGPMRFLDVTFTDLKVNATGQVYQGEVITQADDPADGSTSLETSTLSSLLGSAADKFNNAVDELVSLPIVLGDPDMIAFTIVGLNFGPEEAQLEARLILRIGEGEEEDDFVEFRANGLTIVPNGIADVTTKLGLARAFDFGDVLPLRFYEFDPQEEAGSYVVCDCEGFQAFSLAGGLEVSTDLLQSMTENEEAPGEAVPVLAQFNVESEAWGQFLGEVIVEDSVFIPGLDDLPMYLSTAYIDLNETEDPEGLEVPGAMIDGSWRGMYIPEMSMTLPGLFSGEDVPAPVVVGQGLTLDNNGLTGKLVGTDLIDPDVMDVGGMGFGVDTMEIRLQAGNFQIGKMTGVFNLPLLQAGEGIAYQSFFLKNPQTEQYDFNFVAQPDVVSVPVLNAVMDFTEESSITMGREDGNFTAPVFDLSGAFTLDIGDDKPGLASALQEFIDIVNDAADLELLPEFAMDSILFTHLIYDPNNTEEPFRIESVTAEGTGVTFLGVEATARKLEFGTLADLGIGGDDDDDDSEGGEDEAGELNRELGMAIDMSIEVPVLGEIPLEFAFKLDELKDEDGNFKYSFDGFDFDYELPDLSVPDFSCAAGEELPEPEQTTGSFADGDRIKVGGFEVMVEELDGSAGKGTLRIPFLNYNMDVQFDGLTVNAEGEVTAGEIISSLDDSLLPPEATDASGDGVLPKINYTPEFEEYIATAQELLTLPISLNEVLNEVAGIELPDGMDIIVVGMSFNTAGGQMNMLLRVPAFAEGEYLTFGIRGLNIRPDGIDLGQLKLFLGETIQF